MQEQLGAEFVQVALGLEGGCLVGPCRLAGPSDPAAPLAKPHPEPRPEDFQGCLPPRPLLSGLSTLRLQPPGVGTLSGAGARPGGGGLPTQAAQGLQGCRGQGFVEDGHGPQLALQGGGAAPARVLGACKGGADAALLWGGPQPRPPAQPCSSRD